MKKSLSAAMSAIALTGILAGCSASASVGIGPSTPSVTGEELAPQVSKKLEETVGQTPDAVDCPDGLKGVVGQTTTCVLTAGEDTVDVTVTVISVEGSKINFETKVADAPNPRASAS